MTRQQGLHLALLVAVVLLAVLIGNATGAIEVAAGVVVASAVLLHLGAFAALIGWAVARVRRDRRGSAAAPSEKS